MKMRSYRTIEKIIENGIEYDVNEYSNGDKCWFYKDKLHRKDGPAIEFTNEYKAWFKHDNFHREDGPAIECLDGTKKILAERNTSS